MRKAILMSLLVLLLLVVSCTRTSSEAEAFAKCLSEKDVKMFGAYWCPHCQDQKKVFGDAWEEINYIECSLPGGRGQTEVCQQAGIESYPTWEFANGERMTGVLSFGQLAAKTGCELP